MGWLCVRSSHADTVRVLEAHREAVPMAAAAGLAAMGRHRHRWRDSALGTNGAGLKEFFCQKPTSPAVVVVRTKPAGPVADSLESTTHVFRAMNVHRDARPRRSRPALLSPAYGCPASATSAPSSKNPFSPPLPGRTT
jgi:hypothetical protein